MIYALIGQETLLVRQALERLLSERIPSTAREFNFDTFEGREVEVQKLMQVAQTLPVLASQRVILVRNADDLKKGEMDRLESVLPEIPKTTDLIFVAEKADRRLKFWQRLGEIGKVQEFKPLYPREVPPWIQGEARSGGFSVDPDAAQWMVSALGTDLSLIHSTLEKLYLLKGGEKKISLADVESCVTAFSWKSVFDLTEAVGRRDLRQALTLFKRMFSAGESPIALLALLARHFRILIKVKEGETRGIPPFFLKDYQRQAGTFRREELNEKNEKIFQTDWALKSSPLSPSILFERLLFNLCQ